MKRHQIKPVSYLTILAILVFSLIAVNKAFLLSDSSVEQAPTPTIPLVPDLDLFLMVEQLLSENSCQLPCWWGLNPGQTSIDEIESFLISTGLYRDLEVYNEFYEDADIEFSLEEMIVAGERFGVGLPEVALQDSLRDSSLKAFQVNFTLSPDEETYLLSTNVELNRVNEWLSTENNAFELAALIQRVKTHPDVYFLTAASNQQPNDITVILVFEERGLWVSYRFPTSTIPDLRVNGICTSTSLTLELDIWMTDPSNSYFLERVKRLAATEVRDIVRKPSDIWNVTDTEFIHSIINDPMHCFTVN